MQFYHVRIKYRIFIDNCIFCGCLIPGLCTDINLNFPVSLFVFQKIFLIKFVNVNDMRRRWKLAVLFLFVCLVVFSMWWPTLKTSALKVVLHMYYLYVMQCIFFLHLKHRQFIYWKWFSECFKTYTNMLKWIINWNVGLIKYITFIFFRMWSRFLWATTTLQEMPLSDTWW